MEEGVFAPTEVGSPQGGVASPLMANIALHGMEEALSILYDAQGFNRSKRALIKYADDFLVFCETQEDAHQAKTLLTDWLKVRGLTLSEEKTRIVHLSEGLDFLGFHIQHYKDKRTKTGWKLLITPSARSVQAFRDKVKERWMGLRGQAIASVLRSLNPLIRGWANYFRTGVVTRTFHQLDEWMLLRQARYLRRMHPKKSWRWIAPRYYGRLNLDKRDRWVFGDKQHGGYLLKLRWFRVQRHVLVKGNASPDNPRLQDYWNKRQAAKAKSLVPSRQKLARKQNFRCPVCGESLFNDEELHVHHVEAKSKGGANTYSNLQLLHLFCHQQVTAAQTR